MSYASKISLENYNLSTKYFCTNIDEWYFYSFNAMKFIWTNTNNDNLRRKYFFINPSWKTIHSLENLFQNLFRCLVWHTSFKVRKTKYLHCDCFLSYSTQYGFRKLGNLKKLFSDKVFRTVSFSNVWILAVEYLSKQRFK